MIVTRDNGPGLEEFVAFFRDQQISRGREINPFVLSADELGAKLQEGNHFLGRVIKGEKVFLIGDVNELVAFGRKFSRTSGPSTASRFCSHSLES